MAQITRRRLLSTIAGIGAGAATVRIAGANSGTTLPTWGQTSGTTDLQAGPLGLNPANDPGQVPVAMRIPDAGVDAEVERQQIVDGQMLDPTGPWVVAWYEQTARAGELGNMVGSGHVDYWDVGPSVFHEVASLQEGALIEVIGKNGATYGYEVENIRRIDLGTVTVDELNSADIVGRTDYAAITLITCGGDFNGQEYTQRDIIRGRLVSVQGVESTETESTDGDGTTAGDAADEGGDLAEGGQATVNTDGVNLRAEPSTDGEVVSVLANGTIVTITGDSQEADEFTWLPVELEDGTTGWVAQDFLTLP
jgi:sortase (surface protein transpeptidase)